MTEDSTWKEMERTVRKDGFREGTAKGSESSFQTGFDDGFTEGMKYGKLLGQAHGMKIMEKNEKDQAADTQRGNCYICAKTPINEIKSAVPEAIYSMTFQELKESQKMRNENPATS